jgi:hypothetical protein
MTLIERWQSLLFMEQMKFIEYVRSIFRQKMQLYIEVHCHFNFSWVQNQQIKDH